APQAAAAPAGQTQPPAASTPAPAAKRTQAAREAERSQAAHQEHYHPPQAAVSTRTYQLPSGTDISVRTEETIDSAKGSEGQTYAAEVTKDVLDADGAVVIPEGSNAKLVIRSLSKGGRFTGATDLVLDLRAVSVEGQEYLISAAGVQKRGNEGVGANKRTAIFTGAGAAIGAVIGAIAGGGKGAAIGAASGAGAGAAAQVLTKGDSIKVPAETILTFKLDRPLRVNAVRYIGPACAHTRALSFERRKPSARRPPKLPARAPPMELLPAPNRQALRACVTGRSHARFTVSDACFLRRLRPFAHGGPLRTPTGERLPIQNHCLARQRPEQTWVNSLKGVF